MEEKTITKKDHSKKSLSQTEKTAIKSMIEGFLELMNIGFDSVEIVEDSLGGNNLFVIRTKESGILIGEGGETLNAITHILRRMAQKGSEEAGDFSIDINDYKSSMIERLKSKAEALADKARLMRSNVEMEPMSSYERLIVHGALSGKPNVKTESIGEGKDRRVIIKYVDIDLF